MNQVSKINTATGALVDRLGDVKAQVAALTEVERDIKDELIRRGVGTAEGERYRVTVTEQERNTLDMDAVRAKLSPQFVAAHTTTSVSTVVKCVARTRK